VSNLKIIPIFAALNAFISMSKKSSVIYDKNTVEFVAVGVQYCSFIEQAGHFDKNDFTDKMIKILPLLYLKSTMLPEGEPIFDEQPETFVTEYDYEFVRINIAEKMGKDDVYLEVFSPEMAFSDTPVTANISEDLSDIYQDIKNFISVYELGFENTMNDALILCKENFKDYWGQKAVNVLRALHAVKYSPEIGIEDEL
jgi:hypothetical protein